MIGTYKREPDGAFNLTVSGICISPGFNETTSCRRLAVHISYYIMVAVLSYGIRLYTYSRNIPGGGVA